MDFQKLQSNNAILHQKLTLRLIKSLILRLSSLKFNNKGVTILTILTSE